jgi:hypothetical protein
VPALDRRADPGGLYHKEPGIEIIGVGIDFEDTFPFMGYHAAYQTGSAANTA